MADHCRVARLIDMRDRLRVRPYRTREFVQLYGVGRRQILRDLTLLQSGPLYTPLVYDSMTRCWSWFEPDW